VSRAGLGFALQRIRSEAPQVHLWLVGDGPLRSQLEQQVARLGLDGHIRFLGIQTDVASYLRAADLFLLMRTRAGAPAEMLPRPDPQWLTSGWLKPEQGRHGQGNMLGVTSRGLLFADLFAKSA
jgi:hypothetical protein